MKKTIDHVEIFEVVTPENYNEQRYIQENADVREAIDDGTVKSGWQHFKRHGVKEHRKQLKENYLKRVLEIKEKKSKRIETILREGTSITKSEDNIFDYTGEGRRDKFNFESTDKVSSFFYDQIPLDIINSLPEGLILDCGAGFRPVYYDNVVNYEIVPYATTDVLGFAEDLPFADNSFDALFSFAVLEHVKYPFIAAKEMTRVLKPGGKLAVSAAFLSPLHGYPHHYFNMTGPGMKVLFEAGIEVEKQFVTHGTGPISTLNWILHQWSNNLPEKEKKKFMKMRVRDLMGPADTFNEAAFVNALPEQVKEELASATFLVGTKK